jgi:hypothetical protein
MWSPSGLDTTRGCIVTRSFKAPPSGIRLDEDEAAIVKGMLARQSLSLRWKYSFLIFSKQRFRFDLKTFKVALFKRMP